MIIKCLKNNRLKKKEIVKINIYIQYDQMKL